MLTYSLSLSHHKTEQTARRFADKAVTEAVKKKKRASIAGVAVDFFF